MKCKLCLQDKPLIKAHIIPDFMYRNLYDENHQIHKVNFLDDDKIHTKKIPTGTYDKKILCADCDNNIISPYENYAKMIIYGGDVRTEDDPSFQRMKNQFGLESMRISNINYTKFKLFLLSLLFRGSVTCQTLFKDVKLKPEDKEKIRLMLLNGDAGDFYDYPCVIMTFVDTSLHKDLIASPRKDINEERFNYVIDGIIYSFIVSKENAPVQIIDSFSLNKNNEVHFVYLTEDKAKKFLNNYLGFDLYQ